MRNLETLKANLETLKNDRRKIIALTQKATPRLDDIIRDLEIKVNEVEKCQCFPESCHECYVPIQNLWGNKTSER